MGAATIYAANELSTAWAEYNQGFVQHPALIAQLELNVATLADLTDEATLANLDTAADVHRCEWRMDLDKGEVPETHRLRERLIKQDFDGVVYPSFMSPGGTCVALWRWNTNGAPRLDVVDPDSRLPKTPASWM
jgi:RES domain-containing protein